MGGGFDSGRVRVGWGRGRGRGRDLDPLGRRLTNLCLMIGAMNPGTKGLQPRLEAKGLQATFTQAFCPTFWKSSEWEGPKQIPYALCHN